MTKLLLGKPEELKIPIINKSLMYRLRFAGKYVENKKKTFDRIVKGLTNGCKLRGKLGDSCCWSRKLSKEATVRLKEASLDKAILRESIGKI